MSDSVRSFSLGEAKIHIINIGNIELPLGPQMNIAEEKLSSRDDLQSLREQTQLPIQMILAQLPEANVLVDAGIYAFEPDSGFLIEGYVPPPSLVEQLLELGIGADQIDHVIITHRHWDHFNGTTVELDGKRIPTFPKAKYYLGKPDWDSATEALQDPDSIESRTLAILEQHNVLEKIDGDLDLGIGVEILATPGETRGHQCAKISSGDEVIYCLGDLFHHHVEFMNIDWGVRWARSNLTIPSRERVMGPALEENAYLVATHIPSVGKLRKTKSGVVWEAV